MDLNNFLNMDPQERLEEIERYERLMDLTEENGRGTTVMLEQLERMSMNLLNAYFYHSELNRNQGVTDAVYP